MNTAACSLRPSRGDLFRWELRWAAAEVAGVALGLLLGQVFDYEAAGNVVLFGVLALSGIVRFRHYSRLAPRVEGAESRGATG
jgi:hypothetical protein